MARDRIRDFTKTERLHNESRVQGSPGAGGRARIGGAGGSGGVRGQQAVTPPPGRGVNIQHVTLLAISSQTIASGGAPLGFDRIAGAPTEVRGFPTLLGNLTTSGEVFAIPLDVTGVYSLRLMGLWASYRDGGDITITLTRNGATRGTWTVQGGPITSRFFAETIVKQIEGRSGDTLTVTLPNSSGSDQTLTWATLQLAVSEVASPTSPILPQAVYQDDFTETSLKGFWNVKQAVPGTTGYLDDPNDRYVITTETFNITGAIYLDNDEDGGSGYPGIPVNPDSWKLTANVTHQDSGGADGDITWFYVYCRNIDDGSAGGMAGTDRGLAMVLDHFNNTLTIHDYAGFSGSTGSKASKSFSFSGNRTDEIEFEYTGSEVKVWFNGTVELTWSSGPLSFPGSGRDTRRSFQMRGWNGGAASTFRAINSVVFTAVW